MSLNPPDGIQDAGGSLEETEAIMRDALELDEALHGANHPDVAVSLNNLAELLCAQGRCATKLI
jgi:hypothetical protein